MKTNHIITFALPGLLTLISPPSTAFAQGNASPPGVVKSVNGLAGQVSLFAGPGVTITPAGNGLIISAQPSVAPDDWHTTGNAGSTAGVNFLGTTDDQPLELKVNGRRAWRLEPTTDGVYHSNIVNVVGGSPANFVSPGIYGATIAGGGAAYYLSALYCGSYLGSGSNGVQAAFGSIGGGVANTIEPEADNSTIAGGVHNLIESNSFNSTIGGGVQNRISATRPESGCGSCTISGGSENTIGTNASGAVIGGGFQNIIQTSAWASTVVGGARNLIGNYVTGSTIGGGGDCIIGDNSSFATISGGSDNQVTGSSHVGLLYTTIGGGVGNTVGDTGATVPGGIGNTALGFASFAAGHLATANHRGAFVWSDTSSGDFASATNNQFSVRASGGVRFFSDGNATVGVQLAAGGNSWAAASDRNLKENFQPASPREVLARVSSLPIQTYNLKTQDPAIRHIGPTAQDFQAAFAVGEDDKHIATVDADGVALAAIQGLNQKLTDELKRRDAENTELKARLEKLEQRLNEKANNAR